MQIHLGTSIMHLEDEPLGVGYASEQVTLKDTQGNTHVIGGQNGKTQVIISLPFIDEPVTDELRHIATALPKGGAYEVTAAIVVGNKAHSNPDIEGIDFFIDETGEFGDWYGTRIADGPCEKELTKALIVISKDGAIFYDDFLTNLHDAFNGKTLERKVYAAQLCYTGKGCH